MEEIWKPITGFEDYFVSNLGRVRSEKMQVSRIMTQGHDKDGYMCVNLSYLGRKTNIRVHCQVAREFIDNPNNLPCVDHIDQSKTNNHIINLRWCDKSQNGGNRRINRNSVSGFKGVRRGPNGNWTAIINCAGIKHRLGIFRDPREAAAAYNTAALHYFGEFASINDLNVQQP